MGDEKEGITQEGDGADSYPEPTRATDGTEDAEMNIFENEKLKEFFHHMARIKAVRLPGEGKPKTLDDALKAAHRQEGANRRWVESGRPLGEIKVWAEGRTVMSVLPRLPAQLRHFTFDMPSPEAAVLQLTTQMDGEVIVLLNLRLSDVPKAGLDHTEVWPSGEKLSLSVSRDGKGKFHVKVELNPKQSSRVMKARAAGAGAEESVAAGVERGFDAEVGDRDSGLSERTGVALRTLPPAGWWANLKTALSLKSLATVSAAAVALLFCAAGLAWSGFVPGLSPVSHARGRERHCERAPDLRETESIIERAEITTGGPSEDPGPIITVPASAPRPAIKAPRTNERRQRKPRAQPPAADGKVLKAGYRGTPGTSDPNANRTADVGSSAWEARRAAKLAAVQNVFVQFGRPEAGDDSLAETLRVSFVNALEHSKQFHVVGDSNPPTTDAVITVRFEPDDARLGAVFMDVRDAKGNFLWQDFTGCRRQGEDSEPAVCADASARLVDNFRGAVALAQQSPMRPESFVAGQ